MVAPGLMPFSAAAVRTVNGIAIASMKPGTFSVDTIIVFDAASTLRTTPRIGWRSSAPEAAGANNMISANPAAHFLPNLPDPHRDLGANRRAIALHADQPHVDPVVALTGILEQPQRVAIRGHRSANLRDDVLVAVAVEIGEGDAVALVQLAGPRRLR